MSEYEKWFDIMSGAIAAGQKAYNEWDKKGPPPEDFDHEAAKTDMLKHGALVVCLPDRRSFQLARAAATNWLTNRQQSELVIPPYSERAVRKALLGHGYAEIAYLIYIQFEISGNDHV